MVLHYYLNVMQEYACTNNNSLDAQSLQKMRSFGGRFVRAVIIN